MNNSTHLKISLLVQETTISVPKVAFDNKGGCTACQTGECIWKNIKVYEYQ